ncbi:hypothetical protein CIHG_05911, partial [Coccidioides immitis H538.4]
FKVLEETCSTELPFSTSAQTLIIGAATRAPSSPTRRSVMRKSMNPHRGPHYSTGDEAVPPMPTQPGAIASCGAYYNVVPGDTVCRPCVSIARRLSSDEERSSKFPLLLGASKPLGMKYWTTTRRSILSVTIYGSTTLSV